MNSSETSVPDRLKEYSFYHVIEVEPGLFTEGIKEFQRIQRPVVEALSSLPIAGRRVLDIGCRDGLFSFQAEKAGASEVIGIDNDLSKGALEVLIPCLKSKVEMYEMNLVDLLPEHFGRFDVIIFAGVLYHLRYPIYCLRQIANVLNERGIVIIETAVVTGYAEVPLMYCPSPEDSPYEPSSVTFFNIKGLANILRSLGLEIISHDLLDKGVPPIDRATIICSLVDTPRDESLDNYWNRTHKCHSSGDPIHRLTRSH